MDLKPALSQIIKGEILDDEETLIKYSKDASIFIIKPKLVIYPKDSDDIKALVKFVNLHPEEKLTLTPRAAATCMSGGAINDSVILDMTKHFNNILEVGVGFAKTQPGVFYRDFEKATLEKGYLLPCYTSSRELNTLGGMVGNNSAGEKTLLYGQTERYVKSLKVVLADGNEYKISPLTIEELRTKLAQNDFEGSLYKKVYFLIYNNWDLIRNSQPKTSKNSTGYYLWKVFHDNLFDLTKLIVGSQGTLGIVTEIEISLVKPKTYSAMLEIEIENLDQLDQIVRKVLQYTPESFECFDDQTLKYSTKYILEIAKDFKKTPYYLRFIKLIPEILESVFNDFPKLVLIAEFTGDDPLTPKHQCRLAKTALSDYKLKARVVSQKDEEKYWIIRRDSFRILKNHSGDKVRTAPFIDDIVINPNLLSKFLPKLKEILTPFSDRITYTIAGHIGNGNFHIIPLMDFSKEEVRAVVPELSEKVFNLVREFNGSMAAEHNDGLVRGGYLPLMYGEEVYQLFKEVKEIFDPNNIFNPHKKTDATIEYAVEHIDKGIIPANAFVDYAKSQKEVEEANLRLQSR